MSIQTKPVTQLINKLREQILHDQGVSLADMDALQAAVDTPVPATADMAQEVHFYRRGLEKHWYQTSAEHIASIKRLAVEDYECLTFHACRVGPAPADPETASYDWMAAEQLKGRVISDGMREAYEEALRSVASGSGSHGQREAEGDAIARSKSILRLVDEYA